MSKMNPREAKLSKLLRDMLGEQAAIDFQDIDAMAVGEPGRTNGEVIAANLVKEACRGERWAIEIIADRTEGKPVQSVKTDDGGQAVEERLNDVTRRHLNAIAEQLGLGGTAGDGAAGTAAGADLPAGADPDADAGGEGDGGGAGEPAARTARPLLDLSEDGPLDP